VSGEQAKAITRVLPDGTTRNMEGTVRPLRRVVPSDVPDTGKPKICARQRAQVVAYKLIAGTAGQWERGIDNEGAHYIEKHSFRDEGIVCANCVFYKGPRACEIVKGEIDPMGICKLWVIPDMYLKSDNGGNESNA
jgi:hypothetical protein